MNEQLQQWLMYLAAMFETCSRGVPINHAQDIGISIFMLHASFGPSLVEGHRLGAGEAGGLAMRVHYLSLFTFSLSNALVSPWFPFSASLQPGFSWSAMTQHLFADIEQTVNVKCTYWCRL